MKQTAAVLLFQDFDSLIHLLEDEGFTVIGPRIKDQAIVYDSIYKTQDLPVGWTDEHEKGHYRLKRRDDEALFGYVVGPESWKKYLHKPKVKLWSASNINGQIAINEQLPMKEQYAFIGVRGCELEAIKVQDKIFLDGEHQNTNYAALRKGAFIVAVNCITSRETCFCVSMNTGPKAGPGYDLTLTELITDTQHEFLIEAGSDRGASILNRLPVKKAEAAHITQAETVVLNTAAHMGRVMNTDGLKELIQKNPEHAIWDDVAERCLSCANCTMVCPTCFCTTVEDVTDLTGDNAERWQYWDSCFTADFSFIHGGSVRQSVKSRYRQWMTHKLSSWIDQFGTSGCTGCGRCITWCPVGIDITEEVRKLEDTTAEGVAG